MSVEPQPSSLKNAVCLLRDDVSYSLSSQPPYRHSPSAMIPIEAAQSSPALSRVQGEILSAACQMP